MPWGQKRGQHHAVLPLFAWHNSMLILLLLPLASGVGMFADEDVSRVEVVAGHDSDTGAAIVKTHRKKPIKKVWTKTCWGYETPWSEPCSDQCVQEKRFRLMVDEGCPQNVPLNDSVQVRLCMGDNCAITHKDNNPFMRGLREAMFEFGFETEDIDALSEMSESLQLPLQVMILFIVSSVCWARSFRASWIPDVVVAMPVTAIFALTLRFFCFRGLNFGEVMIEGLAKIVSSLMNDLLLPVTIFVGAFTVDRLNMFAEFGCSLVLAVGGTLAQIFLVFVMIRISGADYLGFHVVDNWREALTYASFIADVDPVITLSIFQKLKVPPLLFTLAGGEGLLNDPIALVLFGMLNVSKKELKMSSMQVAIHIVWNLIGSALVGIAAGVALTKYMSVCKVPGKGSLECIFVLCSAYFSYALGEFLNLSGIIVSLFAGFVMGGLCSHLCANLHQVEEFLENLAVFSEIGMFMIVGFGTFLIDDFEELKLGLITVPFCVVARLITMAFLVPVMNVFRQVQGQDLIDGGTACMLFWCNLRGSIVVMMALEVKSYWSVHQQTILGASIIVIMVMNYLSGCTIPLMFHLTGVPLGKDFPPGSLYHPDALATRVISSSALQVENWAAWNGHRASAMVSIGESGSDAEAGVPAKHGVQGRQMQQPAKPKGSIELAEMSGPPSSRPPAPAKPEGDAAFRIDRSEMARESAISNVTEEWDGEDSPDDSSDEGERRAALQKDIGESY